MNKYCYWGGSPGLVIMGGDSCSEGPGFESQHRILDGHFSHLFAVKIVMFVWKDENKLKRGRGCPFKKTNIVILSRKRIFHSAKVTERESRKLIRMYEEDEEDIYFDREWVDGGDLDVCWHPIRLTTMMANINSICCCCKGSLNW